MDTTTLGGLRGLMINRWMGDCAVDPGKERSHIGGDCLVGGGRYCIANGRRFPLRSRLRLAIASIGSGFRGLWLVRSW